MPCPAAPQVCSLVPERLERIGPQEDSHKGSEATEGSPLLPEARMPLTAHRISDLPSHWSSEPTPEESVTSISILVRKKQRTEAWTKYYRLQRRVPSPLSPPPFRAAKGWGKGMIKADTHPCSPTA